MTEVLDRPMPATARPEPADDLRAKALARLEKKRDFRTHLFVFVVVNAFLWAIWGVVFATTGFWFPWPVFPLFGWGIGLAMHAWDVYRREGFTEEEIERELARLR
jgi:uncharacterized membrane protein